MYQRVGKATPAEAGESIAKMLKQVEGAPGEVMEELVQMLCIDYIDMFREKLVQGEHLGVPPIRTDLEGGQDPGKDNPSVPP